jgi:holo-[acyl-carrier protein] synthase
MPDPGQDPGPVTGAVTGKMPRTVTGSVIGVGIDAVDVERFRRSLERTPAMRERLFTPTELAYVRPKADPVPSLAARFAAREAVMKSMGVGLGAFGFHDVWVERAESGAPSLAVTGPAAALAVERGITTWHLSLTHTAHTAIALVVAS